MDKNELFDRIKTFEQETENKQLKALINVNIEKQPKALRNELSDNLNSYYNKIYSEYSNLDNSNRRINEDILLLTEHLHKTVLLPRLPSDLYKTNLKYLRTLRTELKLLIELDELLVARVKHLKNIASDLACQISTVNELSH